MLSFSKRIIIYFFIIVSSLTLAYGYLGNYVLSNNLRDKIVSEHLEVESLLLNRFDNNSGDDLVGLASYLVEESTYIDLLFIKVDGEFLSLRGGEFSTGSVLTDGWVEGGYQSFVNLGDESFVLFSEDVRINSLLNLNNQLLLFFWLPYVLIILLIGFVFVSKLSKPIERMGVGVKELGEGRRSSIELGLGKEGEEYRKAMDKAYSIIKESLDKEIKSKESMRNFFREASHEMRTPLTVFYGYIDLLLENEELSDRGRKWCEMARGEAVRLRDLVDDLLEIESFQPEPQQGEFDLAGYIKERTIVLKDVGQKDVKYVGVDSLIIEREPYYFKRGIDNVFSNILKHTPINCKVLVRVSLEGGNVWIFIEDSGVSDGDWSAIEDSTTNLSLGIDADKYNSINAINPDTTEYSGIGLGQYILKTSVNKVGGEVSFYSSKLGGLGVFISLPLHGE